MTATSTSYFDGSRGFLKATEILAASQASAGPFGHVAAHCLELTLKAFLLASGMEEKDFLPRTNGIGHSITEAWALCVQKGLPLDSCVPSWAARLDKGHDKPHLFRYAPANSGITLPAQSKVLNELRAVHVKVARSTGQVSSV